MPVGDWQTPYRSLEEEPRLSLRKTNRHRIHQREPQPHPLANDGLFILRLSDEPVDPMLRLRHRNDVNASFRSAVVIVIADDIDWDICYSVSPTRICPRS